MDLNKNPLELNKIPEILAPAGGKAQFFAALHAGADAVYLGLPEFNARSRAENFTMEHLAELMPIARQYNMKVLITLNIILKESELPLVIEVLSQLQLLGVNGVIVQDLGLARLIKNNFPALRLHASTQMAIHNIAGIRAAMELGFKRVVLARELTIQEMRKIRRELPPNIIELEAFCHGSLCYSYSGLCFFSGAEDARSGNRGECAYTCRHPYKIVSEPGHGFLFSMKDLNSSNELGKLIDAGIDTLKIEGRKKDAQYVASSVGLYREKLNHIFGFDTTPQKRSSISRQWQEDLSYSFHRETTSLFLKGRYQENVIDLNNPTHKGSYIGEILQIKNRKLLIHTNQKLEKFDGIRIETPEEAYHAKPQHGNQVNNMFDKTKKRFQNEEIQFSLRNMYSQSTLIFESETDQDIWIELPSDSNIPQVGDKVFKIRSNELKRFTDSLIHPPKDARLRSLKALDLSISTIEKDQQYFINFNFTLENSSSIALFEFPFHGEPSKKESTLQLDLQNIFQLLGDIQTECKNIHFVGSFNYFIAKTTLKQFKKIIIESLPQKIELFLQAQKTRTFQQLHTNISPLKIKNTPRYHIKIDRIEYLDFLSDFLNDNKNFPLEEVIFEPKRAFLGKISNHDIIERLQTFSTRYQCSLRLCIPTVIRAWDEALLRPWVKDWSAISNQYEIGNLGALQLLSQYGLEKEQIHLSSDFTLYALNTQAVQSLSDFGIKSSCLSIEDDFTNLKNKLLHWPNTVDPVAILYKDTPLFIAEACSLTALHHGCPSAEVCGYRTLEIENEKKERFFVAHESCKSIVYADRAYSISEYQRELLNLGCDHFRIDFLTRPYHKKQMAEILQLIDLGKKITNTHTANWKGELL